MLKWFVCAAIPLFFFAGCGDLEPEMQDTRTVVLKMDFHKKSSSRSSHFSAADITDYQTHLIYALPSIESLSSSYKNHYNSSFAQELMDPQSGKVEMEIPLNTQMKIFAFLFEDDYNMYELWVSEVREVGYYGESQPFSIGTNTDSLSLGITLQSTDTTTTDDTGSTGFGSMLKYAKFCGGTSLTDNSSCPSIDNSSFLAVARFGYVVFAE
jgi:hypothetical protein